MTLAAQTRESGPYTGDGATTTFAYGFRIDSSDEIQVATYDDEGTETIESAYTLTNVGNASGGNVVFSSAPTSGHIIRIKGTTPRTNENGLNSGGDFDADAIEDSMDKLTKIAQELDLSIGKAVVAPTGDNTDMTLPSAADRASKTFVFDATGAPAAGAALSGVTISGTPADEQVLQYNGSSELWEPVTLSLTLADGDYGDISISSGVFSIDPAAVATASLEDESVTYAKHAAAALATAAADWRAKTASKLLTATGVWAGMAEVTLTDGANISLDLSSGYDFTVTLGGSRTLDNPTSPKVGQKGRIRVVQDGTGSRTLSYGSYYEFAGGTAPTLTATASAEDILYYDVISSTRILITGSVADVS